MIGQQIGNYRIEELVGEGGMGSVYRGIDVMLEREVAVKALRPELARQPELVSRFRAEAITLARLNHSNIATLYNFLKHGDDYFMVMEFVRGLTLDKLLDREGGIPLEQLLRVFCRALDGISQAHALGIIHRDIKPANIMLTPDGEVKVMDFGIARVLGSVRQTKTGRLIGTLEYMSPEQMRGEEADTRSDVYSLGILLYELVSGRVPFICDSDYEMIRAQVEKQPAPPSEFNADLPVSIELAIMRALAKDPDARYQSVAEFRSAIVSAFPGAALKPEIPVSIDDPAIKATRFASDPNRFDPGFGPSSAPGFDPSTGTFTLRIPAFLLDAKAGLESRIGPLNWKHYSAASILILVASTILIAGRGQNVNRRTNDNFVINDQPVIEKKEPVITPLQISPTPERRVYPVRRQSRAATLLKQSSAKPAPFYDPSADYRTRPRQSARTMPTPYPTPYQQKRQEYPPGMDVRIPKTNISIRVPFGIKKKKQ